MCGRYSLGLPHDEIQALEGYDVQMGEWVDQEQFHPRHNVAPRSQAPVIRRRHSGPAPADEDSGEIIMHTMKWGVVPHWSQFEDTSMNTINARCETLVQGGGLWGSIKGKKRCAIPCEGYYEWLKKGKERIPYFTKREDGRLMLLAGMYDTAYLDDQTTPLWTFTIVTTDANKDFSWLHDRQPVILSTTEALQAWLDTSSQQWTPQLNQLVQPYSGDATLSCYAVPKEVGKVGTESPTFIHPISQRQDGIQAMFAKQNMNQNSTMAKSNNKRQRSITPEPSTRGDAALEQSSSKITPVKRRKVRRSSPSKAQKEEPDVIDLCDTEEEEASTMTPAKKSNITRDASMTDSNRKIKEPPTPQTKSPAKKIRAAKTTDTGEPTSTKKITSFFKKT